MHDRQQWVQEQAIEMALLLSYEHWLRPYGSTMASRPWNASPYGRALVSGHRTASHRRVWHDCRAHSNLRWRWPSSDLDVGEAALWNGCSDRHRVPTKSDRGKKAGGHTLDCLLHILAEMAHLRLRLAVREIAGARSCICCCVSHANGGGIMGCHHNERVGRCLSAQDEQSWAKQANRTHTHATYQIPNWLASKQLYQNAVWQKKTKSISNKADQKQSHSQSKKKHQMHAIRNQGFRQGRRSPP